MDFVPPQRILDTSDYFLILLWLLIRSLPFLFALLLIISRNKYGFLLGAADQLFRIVAGVPFDRWFQLVPAVLLLIIWLVGFLWWHFTEPRRPDPVDLLLKRPDSDHQPV